MIDLTELKSSAGSYEYIWGWAYSNGEFETVCSIPSVVHDFRRTNECMVATQLCFIASGRVRWGNSIFNVIFSANSTQGPQACRTPLPRFSSPVGCAHDAHPRWVASTTHMQSVEWMTTIECANFEPRTVKCVNISSIAGQLFSDSDICSKCRVYVCAWDARNSNANMEIIRWISAAITLSLAAHCFDTFVAGVAVFFVPVNHLREIQTATRRRRRRLDIDEQRQNGRFHITLIVGDTNLPPCILRTKHGRDRVQSRHQQIVRENESKEKNNNQFDAGINFRLRRRQEYRK